MKRYVSKLVERRELEGIGRLCAAGVDPESRFVVSMLPPRTEGTIWSRYSCLLYDGEWLPTIVIARALGVRIKTFRDWTKEPGFPPPYPAEILLPERLLLHFESGGAISPVIWERYAGTHVFGKKLRRGEWLWCGESVGDWIFANRGHRVKHAYAWWMTEVEFGTWTPEAGYSNAPPMTKRQWVNTWHGV